MWICAWRQLKASCQAASSKLKVADAVTSLRSDEASDDARLADGKLPRGAFPRGFGREGDKHKEVRMHGLLKHAKKPRV